MHCLQVLHTIRDTPPNPSGLYVTRNGYFVMFSLLTRDGLYSTDVSVTFLALLTFIGVHLMGIKMFRGFLKDMLLKPDMRGFYYLIKMMAKVLAPGCHMVKNFKIFE